MTKLYLIYISAIVKLKQIFSFEKFMLFEDFLLRNLFVEIKICNFSNIFHFFTLKSYSQRSKNHNVYFLGKAKIPN